MENKQQPVVNICGSCILRDTFYYQGVYGKEKDGGYRINRYVNFFSPLALEQPPVICYIITKMISCLKYGKYIVG